MEKSKRKENPVIRRKVMIVAILAIFLLVTLVFPVRFLAIWVLNPLVYGLLAIFCGWMVIRLARRIDWRQKAVLLFVVCMLLASVHTVWTFSDAIAGYTCHLKDVGYGFYDCGYSSCWYEWYEYVGIEWVGIHTTTSDWSRICLFKFF